MGLLVKSERRQRSERWAELHGLKIRFMESDDKLEKRLIQSAKMIKEDHLNRSRFWHRLWVWGIEEYAPWYFDRHLIVQIILFLPFWASLFVLFLVWILKMIEGWETR